MDGDRRGPGRLMEQLGEIKQGGSPRCPPPPEVSRERLLVRAASSRSSLGAAEGSGQRCKDQRRACVLVGEPESGGHLAAAVEQTGATAEAVCWAGGRGAELREESGGRSSLSALSASASSCPFLRPPPGRRRDSSG